MYAHCIHCNNPLGANESIEAFPVGRRLAFDGATGRLWVICSACARWNLTPLEERWEAIEQCERAFRGTALRASTDQIGLARVREGTELVRIGAPVAKEFAAWRYGAQFRRRHQKAIMAGLGIGSVSFGVQQFGLPAIMGAFGAPGLVAGVSAYVGVQVYRAMRVTRAKVVADGRVLSLADPHVHAAALVPRADGQLSVLLPHKGAEHPSLSTDSSSWVGTSRVVLDDAIALEALRRIMPRINRAAPARHVNTALDQLAVSADPASFLRATAQQHAVPTGSIGIAAARIWDLPHPMRLAIEMAVNESEERRALSGELGALHAAWREADEIAAIADGLTLPPEVEAELQRLREGRPR